MKLHLPVTLFVALMSLLFTLPAFAAKTLTVGDKVTENWDGQLSELGVVTGSSRVLDGDMQISVNGGDSLTLTASSENYFYQRGNIDIFVTDGGSLVFAGDDQIVLGAVGYLGGGDFPRDEAFHANITIDGGTVDATNLMFGALSRQNFGDLPNSTMSVAIDVKHGQLHLGDSQSMFMGAVDFCSPERGKTVNSTSLKLSVGEGGVAEFRGTSVLGWLSTQIDVEVKDGGVLSLYDGATIGMCSRIDSTQSPAGEVSMKILVGKGSVLNMRDGQLVQFRGNETTGSASLTVDGGTVNMLPRPEGGYGSCLGINGSKAPFTLDLKNGALFNMEDGEIGTQVYASGGVVTINMDSTSRFIMKSGKLANGQESQLTINLNGGEFTVTGGEIAGLLYRKTVQSSELNISGGTFSVTGEAKYTGDIHITGGSLTFEDGCYLGGVGEGNDPSVSIDIASTWNEAVGLNGLDAKYIKEGLKIKGAGATLQGLLAGSTLTLSGEDNTLTVSSKSSGKGEGSTKEGKTPLIGFAEGEEKGTVQFKDADTQVTLNFDDDNLKTLAKAAEENQEEVSFEVWITNGTLKDYEGGSDIAGHFMVGTGWGLKVEPEPTVSDAQDGRLMITGNIANVAFTDKEGTLSEAEKADKVVVMDDTTLTVDEPEGTIKQLEGAKDKNLTLEGKGTVSLENQHTAATNGDTTFKGDIITENGVDLKKTGNAELAVEGNLQAGGNVTVEDGTLTLGGDDNSIDGKLSIEKDGALQVEEDSKLTLNGKDNDLKDVTSDQLSGSGSITVGKDGKLTLNSEMVNDSDLTFGADAGGRLEFTGNTPVDLKKLAEDTTGTVKGTGFTSTDKDATFAGSIEGKLTVKEGSLNMSNAANGGCDLYVVGKDTQATIAPGSDYNSITVGDDDAQNNDKLIVTAAAEGDHAGADIRVTGDIVFRNGAEADFTINLSDPNLWGSDDHDATMLSTGRTIYIEPGTKFVVDCLANTLLNAKGNLSKVILLQGGEVKNAEYHGDEEAMMSGIMLTSLEPASEDEKQLNNVKFDLGVILSQLYEDPSLWTDGKKVWFDATRRNASPWTPVATSRNSGAGLNLLWQHINTAGAAIDPQVENMFTVLDNLVAVNPAEARRVMAAVAGSTLTSLSAAQSAALRNQMGRVRDHALQAGRLRCAGNDEATATQRPCKNSHVWVEGTSFFSEQHSVGDESGYRLNSWGGAVGIDAQVDAHWSVGVSLSASYGDLEARAADYAKGDLDTYTVSFWSQAKNGRWGNTLLFTLGTNEADLKRTVNYGAGSYTATSNTSGSSLGAMWELTYDFHPVKDNKSNILQPLFNVALTRTSMDGFSEKNAGGVGLTTEKQTRDTITLGLGLRWLAAINSAKAVNRTVSTEVHANVAQDMGDRRSMANVALLADPSYTQNVYGSKAGSTAFQFGAGVNVPMTPNSQIYVNAGGELREHANAWNAALGVRMGF